MDGGPWWAAVRGVAKSRTQLSDFTFTFHFYALEKEMATHSSVLAWKIPGTGKPGGLLSMGSNRIGHDWSNVAAVAAVLFSMYHLHCLQPFTTINCTVHVHGRRPRPVKTYERTVEESTALAATSSSCVISRISLCTTGSCGADNPRILRTSLQCIMEKSSAVKAEVQPLPFEAERNFQTCIWANTLPRDLVIIHPSC